jgi:hypothetical protein
MDGRDVFGLLSGWRGAGSVLRQRSLIEGVWNGRRGWLAVAAVVWGARGVSKALSRNEKVLLREVLRPGEQLLISQAIVKPTGRQRRRSAKRAARSGTGS